MIDNQLKLKVEDKVLETICNAEKVFFAEHGWEINFKLPDISYELNSKIVAGHANSFINLVTFNPFFLENNVEKFLKTTVVHEVAHIITRKIYPFAKSYGREWKHVMTTLGATPNRCHDYKRPEPTSRKCKWI